MDGYFCVTLGIIRAQKIPSHWPLHMAETGESPCLITAPLGNWGHSAPTNGGWDEDLPGKSPAVTGRTSVTMAFVWLERGSHYLME